MILINARFALINIIINLSEKINWSLNFMFMRRIADTDINNRIRICTFIRRCCDQISGRVEIVVAHQKNDETMPIILTAYNVRLKIAPGVLCALPTVHSILQEIPPFLYLGYIYLGIKDEFLRFIFPIQGSNFSTENLEIRYIDI